jgi:hypothetical protein
MSEESAKLLSEICIKPLRIAFDDIKLKKTYVQAVMRAADNGILDLSNYILYNYLDKPKDLYERLKINVELNEKLGTKIYSFPMRYTPLDAIDRTYIGESWTKKQIRGIQCIINVTNGIVGPQVDFFLKAFGNTVEEFEQLILMPDLYILNRLKYEDSAARDWSKIYHSLREVQKREFIDSISDADPGKIKKEYISATSKRVKALLHHYLESDRMFVKEEEEAYSK